MLYVGLIPYPIPFDTDKHDWEDHHWSQAELARKLEISRQAINGFELGKFTPSLEMAFKIALFDVAIEGSTLVQCPHYLITLNLLTLM